MQYTDFIPAPGYALCTPNTHAPTSALGIVLPDTPPSGVQLFEVLKVTSAPMQTTYDPGCCSQNTASTSPTSINVQIGDILAVRSQHAVAFCDHPKKLYWIALGDVLGIHPKASS